jgi:hypothetical protein
MTALEKENLIDHVRNRYSYQLGIELANFFTQQEKKDKLLELNNELINAYQAHLVSLHTIDRPMIEKWKNEIFRLLDKIKALEEELKK